jgi:hypothetical protein
VDATNHIGNQEALELARIVDPEGQRTVGLLTKCDVVQPGDEERVSSSSFPIPMSVAVKTRFR